MLLCLNLSCVLRLFFDENSLSHLSHFLLSVSGLDRSVFRVAVRWGTADFLKFVVLASTGLRGGFCLLVGIVGTGWAVNQGENFEFL